LERQIRYNSAISREGLRNVYGAGIGPLLEGRAGGSIQEHAKAAAAAGSDARMNGCALPVVINSGSGNQGITVSVPIIVYAREMGKSREELLRALCVGNLMAIRQKAGIGKLSAFCGATCAAVGVVAGIAYMQYADYETISLLVTNSLATVGGMVCDGAKSSCAGKIATALESAFIGYEAAKVRRGYHFGEGIVKQDVEHTIDSVARMAVKGMYATDMEILQIMLEE
jgi:L-cysteine desulfidase